MMQHLVRGVFRRIVFGVTALMLAAPCYAQTRTIVRVVIQSASGDSIPGARVNARSDAHDTTARANSRGLAILQLDARGYQFTVSVLGYQTRKLDVLVAADTILTVALERVTQQLQRIDVVDEWIGIRGVVGDSSTMQTLSGATIQETSGARRKVFTDSLGRFEIALREAVPMVLRVERRGYRTRTAYVSLSREKHSPEVVIFLNAGKDRNEEVAAFWEYRQRAPWMGARAFMVSREQLLATNQNDVERAVLETGMLQRKGVILTWKLCVFVNGQPQPGRSLSSFNPNDVEFVEFWGWKSEETRTLERRWPSNADCAPTSQPQSRAPSSSLLIFAVVWMKQ